MDARHRLCEVYRCGWIWQQPYITLAFYPRGALRVDPVEWRGGQLHALRDSQLCYLSGYRNAQGESLAVDRDGRRRLLSLSAPHRTWLHFNYDPSVASQGRIADITDSGGRHVIYSYNDRGQLAEVKYPSAEVFSYTYDTSQNLLSVRTNSHSGAAEPFLVTNQFLNC